MLILLNSYYLIETFALTLQVHVTQLSSLSVQLLPLATLFWPSITQSALKQETTQASPLLLVSKNIYYYFFSQ